MDIKQYHFVYIMDHSRDRAATGKFKQHLMEQYVECRLYIKYSRDWKIGKSKLYRWSDNVGTPTYHLLIMLVLYFKRIPVTLK